LPGTFVASSNDKRLYQARIERVQEGTTFYYQVVSPNSSSSIATFGTVASGKPVAFVVLGDSRTKPAVFGAIAEQVNRLQPNVILNVGDLVGSGGNYDEWQRYYFDVAADVINHIPLVPALGDHEGEDDDGRLFTHFFFPQKDYKKLWFSFDVGDAHFVALDYRYPDSEEMRQWFEKDMASTPARWKFVYMHRPCYNFGGHRSNWGHGVWPELFSQYKVDMVFAGHSHLYERFRPTRPLANPNAWPVTYVTTGGAGAPLYEVVQDSALACAKSVNHFVAINLNKDRLQLHTYLTDGTLLDSVSFRKTSDGYDRRYMARIIPQEELDLYGLFAGQISQDLERLPMKKRPAIINLTLSLPTVNEDVDFRIMLTDSAAASYRMAPVTGTIRVGQTVSMPLKIYAKKNMRVSRWGDIEPEIRLIAIYKSGSFHGRVLSKPLSYRDY